MDSYKHYFKTSYLTGSVAISDSLTFPAQIIAIVVKISMKNNFHVYGNPIPKGYIPLTIELDTNSNFTFDKFQFPETKKIKLLSLDETFHILPNKMTLTSYINIIKQPQIGLDSVNIKIKFQACDSNTCMPPIELQLQFQFPIIITKSINLRSINIVSK